MHRFQLLLLFQFTWMTVVLDSIVINAGRVVYKWLAIVLIVDGTLFAVNIFAADWSQISSKACYRDWLRLQL